MKKIININNAFHIGILTLFISLTTACSNTPDYKAVRADVVALHDKLMIDGEKAIHNKMALDTFAIRELPNRMDLDTAAERQQINQLINLLDDADESMMDWMQDFIADVEGMSNEKAVAYFIAEKVKLVKMDSLYKAALDGSEAYLKKFGVKVPIANDGHDHSKH